MQRLMPIGHQSDRVPKIAGGRKERETTNKACDIYAFLIAIATYNIVEKVTRIEVTDCY